MTDTQLIRCSSCKCHRVESAFKINKKGNRLTTCLACNERRRKPIAPPIKLIAFADPPAPIVTMSASDKVCVLKAIGALVKSRNLWRVLFRCLWTHYVPYWREVVHAEHQWRTMARIRAYHARIKWRNESFRFNLSLPGPRRAMFFID
jgi:hypothetical protein